MNGWTGRHRAGASAAALVSTAAAVALALVFAGAASSSRVSARGSRTLTLYSLATNEQFVNNEDDRARGKGNNPFGNYKDVTAVTKEVGNGPFAGDEALFTFDVYASPDLKKKVGTATYTCQYNFDKNAFCDTAYQLSGGTLIGAGAFNFNAKNFEVAITGGTRSYSSLTGDMTASPAANHTQKLAFRLG